jgi:hypothetical protein
MITSLWKRVGLLTQRMKGLAFGLIELLSSMGIAGRGPIASFNLE